MPTTRATSSQNRLVDEDVPPQYEDVFPMSAERLYTYLGTLARLVEHQSRGFGNKGQGQSSSYRGNSFYDFKRLGRPYFSGSSISTKVESWIIKIEKFFDVVHCSEEQKASYATFMLDNEVDKWWRMTRRLLEDQGCITWRIFREAFYTKYFLNNVR